MSVKSGPNGPLRVDRLEKERPRRLESGLLLKLVVELTRGDDEFCCRLDGCCAGLAGWEVVAVRTGEDALWSGLDFREGKLIPRRDL